MHKSMVSVCLLVLGLSACTANAAVTVLSDNFDSYSTGNLVGQGGWLQTGTSATTPIQVGAATAGSGAVLGTSGQDAYDPFGTTNSVPRIAGNVMDVLMTINVASAQATGDYFAHVSDPAGTTSTFLERLFVKSTSGGYLLGLEPTAGGGGVITYGSTVLLTGTDQNVDVTWNFAAGTTSDTFSVSVGGSPYAGLTSVPWGSTIAEPAVISAFNFRQGSASAAPAVTVDNLVVTATAIPEPVSMSILGLGSVALLARRRRTA